jgi:hypothetical protein
MRSGEEDRREAISRGSPDVEILRIPPGRSRRPQEGRNRCWSIPAGHERVRVCENFSRIGFSAPGSPRTPATLEYYVADNLEIIGIGPADRPPGRWRADPIRPVRDRRCLLRVSTSEAPRPLFASAPSRVATVPPIRTGIWKMVGTGELSLPNGAKTRFIPACNPSARSAPPGTPVPVRLVSMGRKLVITEPIAIR